MIDGCWGEKDGPKEEERNQVCLLGREMAKLSHQGEHGRAAPVTVLRSDGKTGR